MIGGRGERVSEGMLICKRVGVRGLSITLRTAEEVLVVTGRWCVKMK